MNGDHRRAADWFAEEWTARFAGVLETRTGEAPRLECTRATGVSLAAATGEISAQHGDFLWWRQDFPLPGEPAVWIGAPQAARGRIAEWLSRVSGEVDESEGRKSYLEILRQSCGELARSTSSRWGVELEPPPGIEGVEPPAEIEFYRVEAVQPEATLPPILIAVSGEPQDPTGNPNGADPQQQSETAVLCTDSRRGKTFDLLMGVELPVSVSFGRVKLPLRDVLKLTAGSIIELNRTVDEPVEVIVNNCIVARGEVVVVEGNYGVRIHQIMSRQQRLESLP